MQLRYCAAVFLAACSCLAATEPLSDERSVSLRGRVEQQGSCRLLAAGRGELSPLVSTCEFVSGLTRALPNFLADQTQTRVTQIDGEVVERNVISATLTYENAREHYSNVQVDGNPSDERAFATAGGFMTFGEFGSLLNGIFSDSSRTEFVANGVDSFNRLTFAFHVREKDNHWWAVREGTQQVFPELRGTLSVERDSYRIRSLSIEAVNIPSSFPSETVTVTSDYDEVAIAGLDSYWLPISSHWRSCLRPIPVSRRLHPTARAPRQTCLTSSVTFQNYRKFAARSRVVPDTP